MHTLSFESRGDEGGGILRLVCCIAIDLGANRIGIGAWIAVISERARVLEPPFFFCFFIGFSFDPICTDKPGDGSHRPFSVLRQKKNGKCGSFQRYTVEHTM